MKNVFKLLSFAFILFLFNCGGDDTPAVVPTVEFTHEAQIVEVGDEVAFVSTHTDATSFAWDFGDGNLSTEQNPAHAYEATGEFTVTLTVTSSTGDTANSTSTVTVGSRWITGFTITSINMVDQNGNPWDANDGPELFFGYAPATASTFSLFDLGDNITIADLPISAALDEASVQQFTNEDWSFIFVDDDEPFGDFSGEASQLIGAITLNPGTIPAANRDLTTGKGVFVVQVQDFDFNIFYDIRN